MSQISDIQLTSLEDILEILRIQAAAIPPSPTSVRYLRAVASLKSSIMGGRSLMGGGHSDRQAAGLRARDKENGSVANFTRPAADTASADTAPGADTPYSILNTSLTDWLVNQWLMNTPFSTASLYLDIISSLYGSAVKAGLLPKIKVFSELKARLKALGPDGWKSGIDDEIFTRALRLTKNASFLIADDAIAADLVIWSLNHSLQPLEEIALLKREDLMEGGHSDRQAVGLRAQNPTTSGLLQVKQEQDGLSSDAPLVAQKTEDPRLLSLITNNLYLDNARRKYVFPLRQSERTPRQLSNHIKKIVNALFKRARLPQSTDPYQTVEALWAYAALRSGIPASQLVSYLGHAPLGLPVLKLSVMGGGHSDRQAVGLPAPDKANGSVANFTRLAADTASADTASADTAHRADTPYCEADTASADTSKEYFSAVGKIFLDNPPRWYAMSLRPGVRFTQVCQRIQLLLKTEDSRLKTEDLTLFYPCEEIARAIGKKIVVRQRPFIYSVVFFRAKLTDIGRLFAKIGDLAWCYRQSARPGAPYADISERQFQLFQQTIASFTPDYEVAPTGELELKKNDRVQILGGLFAGHEATFDGVMGGGHPDRQAVGLRARDMSNGSLARGVAHVTEASRLRPQSNSNSSARKVSENPKRKTDNVKDTAQSADTSTVVYRLNIIGDNGIEWRVNVDSRLLAHGK